MGVELRRVPADWEHPRDAGGQHVPLRDDYAYALACYEFNRRVWETERIDAEGDPSRGRYSFLDAAACAASQRGLLEYKCGGGKLDEWDGPRPDPREYMPVWPDGSCTHYQMYENVSEGAPISPAMPTPEALADWLATNAGSRYGGATREHWLDVIRAGSAPTFVLDPTTGKITSGVVFMGRRAN